MPLVIYGLRGVHCTHICICNYASTYTYLCKGDFKKPGTCCHVPSLIKFLYTCTYGCWPTVKRRIPKFRMELRMRFFLNEKDFTAIIIHFKPKYLFIT